MISFKTFFRNFLVTAVSMLITSVFVKEKRYLQGTLLNFMPRPTIRLEASESLERSLSSRKNSTMKEEENLLLNSSRNVEFTAPMNTSNTFSTAKKEEELNHDEPSIAACILVMDDSIRLLEWIAYHYTVLPLSNLLVVMDPNSKRVSSMLEVLDSWRSRIDITVHVNDSEWMTLNATEGFVGPIHQRNDPSKYQSWFLDKSSRKFQLKDYDRRQTHLITYCANFMRTRTTEKKKPITWTLFIDTDEYLLFNYIHDTQENASHYTVQHATLQTRVDDQRLQNRPYREALPPLSSHVTIARYLQQQQSLTSQTSCFLIPDMLVSSRELLSKSNSSILSMSSSPKNELHHHHLTTMRHTQTDVRNGESTKAMIDVSRLPRGKKDFEPSMVHNIHWPNKQLCAGVGQALRRGTDYIASILRIHHYASGTWEAFIERVGQDRRHVGNRKNISAVDRFLSRSIEPKIQDHDITPWLDWFVTKVGQATAEELLFLPLAQRYEAFKVKDPLIQKQLEKLHL